MRSILEACALRLTPIKVQNDPPCISTTGHRLDQRRLVNGLGVDHIRFDGFLA